MPPTNAEIAQGPSRDDLAERLTRLEDAEAIRALFLVYGAYLDAKDWVPYANLFTSEGEFIAPIGVARGPESIRALFEGRLRDVVPGTHLITNLVVDVNGDSANARALWTYIGRDAGGMPTLTQNGTYESRLTRENGQWMFERHEITRTNGVAPYRS